MKPRGTPRRTLSARASPAVVRIGTALLLAASSAPARRGRGGAEARKLASLGSTLEGGVPGVGGGDALLRPGSGDDALSAAADYSRMACPPPGVGGGDAAGAATCGSSYGVDTSFPVHHGTAMLDDDDPFGWRTKKDMYARFMMGCMDNYAPDLCKGSEEDRMGMNLRQPASMYVSEPHLASCILSLMHWALGVAID